MEPAPALADAHVTAAERRKSGQVLRSRVPRSSHAAWVPRASRPDPVQILIESGRHRIQKLLPIRYARMKHDAFAFLRGGALIMASDLATTPASGLRVQACGDCHFQNFGTYASPEGTLVFDINDFDETLEAPFEWDLKRLAASLAVAARTRRLSSRRANALAMAACGAYRERMADLARMDPLSAWRSRIDIADALSVIEDPKLREGEAKRLQAAVAADRDGYRKLIERRNGAWRIRIATRYTFPLSDGSDETLEAAARAAFRSYRTSLREEQRLIVGRYDLVDLAFKVVGVGSVGTFCAIALLATADGNTMLLQLKEAQESALAAFAGPSPYANQGRRVVVGQRIMQAVTDPFLGWTDDDGDDLPCYVREMKDSRMAMIGETIADGALHAYALLCGRALARAHARSQDAARLAGYMGGSTAFDTAIAAFAMSYADQNERDYRLFLDAIDSGLVEAAKL